MMQSHNSVSERAERAEHKVQELEKTIADLKSRTTESGGQDTASHTRAKASPAPGANTIEDLRAEPMMAHLMDSLEAGKEIGHYGRLVFAMVGHHFVEPGELIEWLTKDPDFDAEQAKALL